MLPDRIRKVGEGVAVSPLLWALHKNEHLWNEVRDRTESPSSPHHEIDDIWARYAKYEESQATGPHESVWYPSADILPVRDLAHFLMQYVRGERLGGVLLTRIKAGARCKPHSDSGWHADYYQKFAIQVQSSPGQFFCFEGQRLEPMPGDIYWFDNSYTHWVENDTAHDRVTLIVCIKT